MKIGISSSCFYPSLTEKAFEKAILNGAETVEIFFNCAQEIQHPLLDKFIELKNEYSVTVNTIHPYTSFAEPFVLFGGYSRRLSEGIDFYKKYFEAAQALNSKAVVIHGGKPPEKEKEDEYLEAYFNLCCAAKPYGVYPAVENVNNRMGQSIAFLEKLKEASGEMFRTVLDIKQCRRSGTDEFEIIRKFGKDIIQVHISDFNSHLDCIPPGEGYYNFDKLFRELISAGYNESALIELYNWSFKNENQIKNSLDYMKKMAKNIEKQAKSMV